MGNEQSAPLPYQYNNRNQFQQSYSYPQPQPQTQTQTQPQERRIQLPPDPYVFFGLTPECTEEQAKRAYYRKTKEYHPDRGGDVQVFNWIHQSYIKVLHEIQERNRRVEDHLHLRRKYQESQQQQESLASASKVMQKVYEQPKQQYQRSNPTHYEPPPKPAGAEPKFNSDKFNKIFEETYIQKASDRGYGNSDEFDKVMSQLPQQPTMNGQSSLQGGAHDQFMNQFNSHKQQWQNFNEQQTKHNKSKEIAKYKGPEALVSTSFANCVELGDEEKDDFTAPMQSSIAYTDYQGAYTRYHQLEENLQELNNRPNNLEAYKSQRDNIRFTLNPEEEAQQAAIKAYEEEQEQIRIARLQEEDRLTAIQHEKARKLYLQGRGRN